MALAKDLLIVDAIIAAEPDLILWPITLESFPRDKQMTPPLVQNNPERVRRLIDEFKLDLDPQDERLNEPEFLERSIAGQRRALADWLRLQFYGFSWAATGVDQAFTEEITPRQSDFDEDLSWQEFSEPATLGDAELAFDVLGAGQMVAGDVPVLIVNEPIYISRGQNSDLRYNAWYPRWAYDSYRELLASRAAAEDWTYLDLWDGVDPAEFTDSPVHLTPAGVARFTDLLVPSILDLAG
jgi:hypothetical protein